MTTKTSLFLHEELLLLALRDKEGTIAASTYSYAVAGAVLAELMLRELIEIEPTEHRRVHPLSAVGVGNVLIDECLAAIVEAKRPQTLADWVTRFADIRHLRDRVAEGLCDIGILHKERGTFLLVFPKTIYPEVDHGPEGEVMERLRRAIFDDNEQLDSRTAVLLSIAHRTDMLSTIFDRKELEDRREHIERVTSGEAVGQAAKEAIEMMQTVMTTMSIGTTWGV